MPCRWAVTRRSGPPQPVARRVGAGAGGPGLRGARRPQAGAIGGVRGPEGAQIGRFDRRSDAEGGRVRRCAVAGASFSRHAGPERGDSGQEAGAIGSGRGGRRGGRARRRAGAGSARGRCWGGGRGRRGCGRRRDRGGGGQRGGARHDEARRRVGSRGRQADADVRGDLGDGPLHRPGQDRCRRQASRGGDHDGHGSADDDGTPSEPTRRARERHDLAARLSLPRRRCTTGRRGTTDRLARHGQQLGQAVVPGRQRLVHQLDERRIEGIGDLRCDHAELVREGRRPGRCRRRHDAVNVRSRSWDTRPSRARRDSTPRCWRAFTAPTWQPRMSATSASDSPPTQRRVMTVR